MSQKKAFQVGDRVRWTSTSNGSTVSKEGTIAFVVSSERSFLRALGEWQKSNPGELFRTEYGGGLPRDHVSYGVIIRNNGTKRDVVYWPRASLLEGS